MGCGRRLDLRNCSNGVDGQNPINMTGDDIDLSQFILSMAYFVD